MYLCLSLAAHSFLVFLPSQLQHLVDVYLLEGVLGSHFGGVKLLLDPKSLQVATVLSKGDLAGQVLIDQVLNSQHFIFGQF